MKHVLIVENGTESLKANDSVENSSKYLLSGKFTEFDVENRNKRFYTADNFVPVMNNLLEKKKMLGVLYGEFDHPDVFDIAGKNASHAIEGLSYNEQANCVDGSIALLSTHYGKEARAIINDGYPLFVSSRAAGVTDANGNVALKELFTYDIVLDPGFTTSQVSVNESYGYSDDIDVPYRIYEMNDSTVNNLHLDNKNDKKTHMDLKMMEQILETKMVQLEHTIMEKIKNASGSTEEIFSLSEKHESVNEELVAVKLYLEEFKKQMNHLVKQNNSLVESNKTLTTELNENTMYSNHLASGLKQLNKYTSDIDSRLSTDEKMIEYVAEHTKSNILLTENLTNDIKTNSKFIEYVAKETEITQQFTESVAKETEIAQKFGEYVANETKVAQLFTESIAKETETAQKFTEYVANETKITQKFTESVAKETEIAQKFGEYVANESFKDQVFLDYISEKVDGMVGYQSKLVSKLKSNTPIVENVSDDDSIHTLENIEDYLGITEEKEIVNNITEENITTIGDATETEVEPTTKSDNTNIIAAVTEVEETENNTETEEVEPTVNTETEEVEPIVNTEEETSLETELLQSVVKMLSSDETGIIIEVTTDDKVIIQKSGSDETVEMEHNEYEVMDVDNNITETVSTVLAEIKKQQTLANQEPHFLSFLSEQQVTDFRNLEKSVQNSITLALDESEYYSSKDVLDIIGDTLNKSTVSYEDKLISNVPENIKEAWNSLSKDNKVSIITESKYFSLSTSADMKSFWATRPFAKNVTSPEATLIKEALNTETKIEFDNNYIDAFMKSVDNMSIK